MFSYVFSSCLVSFLVTTPRCLVLQEFADLIKFEARAAGKKFCLIAVTEIAQEIGFYLTELEHVILGCGVLHSRRKELFIHFGVIEARQGSAIQPEGARRKNEIRALKSAIAERRDFGQFRRLGEPFARCGVVRKKPGQLLVEIHVVGNNRSHRRLHGFFHVGR